MDTTRHHDISRIGAAIIREELARVGRRGLRIEAFALGNWLTDVSQFVDIPVYHKVLDALTGVNRDIHGLFTWLFDAVPHWAVESLGHVSGLDIKAEVEKGLAKSQTAVTGGLEALLKNGGKVSEGLRDAFYYMGYVKFVLPKDGSSRELMDSDAFEKIVADRFRAYYPHEHLDRPVVNERPVIEKSSGPLNAHAHASSARQDLYTHLRDDVRLAAGLIAYLDTGKDGLPPGKSGWAAATFSPLRSTFTAEDGKDYPVSDTDYQWNRHLALLGHALHTVEDYFGHSTFVEHASSAFPGGVSRFQRLEDQEILARRLKELDPSDGRKPWRKLTDDTHVATGYFDFQDTLLSLRHGYQEFRGHDRETIGKKADDLVEYDYLRLLTDTLELAETFESRERFQKLWNAPVNDPTHDRYGDRDPNVAVKWLREKGGTSLALLEGKEAKLNYTLQFMRRQGPLKGMPDVVWGRFERCVRTFSQVIGFVGLTATLYSLFKEAASFLTDPAAWLAKFLPQKARELLRNAFGPYIRRRVDDLLGANRIGCHSLINKDSGPELFHDQAIVCAKTVDTYLLHALTRHARPAPIKVARGDAGSTLSNLVPVSSCVDWLELVEYFLAHPLAYCEASPTPWVMSLPALHFTQGTPGQVSSDTLQGLAEQYGQSYVRPPNGPAKLTWEMISDANFPTRDMTKGQRAAHINRMLRERMGVPVGDGRNYAFKAGFPITIPHQRVEVQRYEDTALQERWWYRAIVKHEWEHWRLMGRLTPSAPRAARPWYAASRGDHDAFVRKALADRTQKESDYDRRRA